MNLHPRGLVFLLIASTNATAAGEGSDVLSLLNLPLNDLINIKVQSASLTGATQGDAASWVSVIDESDWRNNGARRLFDALQLQPATLSIPYVGGGEAVAIRGYSSTNSHLGVALLLDGIPLTDFAYGSPMLVTPNIPLFALTSIEYTEGAGSALHGSDAFHGVIGLNSFEPTHHGNTFMATAGSNSYYEAGIRGGDDISEQLSASVTAAANGQSDQNLDYQTRNPANGAALSGERDMRFATGAFIAHLNQHVDSNSFQLSVYQLRYDAWGQPGVGPRLAQSNDQGEETTTLQMLRASGVHRFSSTGSSEIHAYLWQEDNALHLNQELNQGQNQDAINAIQTQATDQHRYGLQILLKDDLPTLNTRWALALARDELGIDDARAQLRTVDGSIVFAGASALNNQTRTIDSATFEADSALFETHWHSIVGARLDNYSDFGHQFSPRLGLIYHPRPQDALKLIYSEAFRAPTAGELYGSSSSIESNPALSPEIIHNHEAIWLHQDEKHSTQLSVFQSFWRDGIMAVGTDVNGIAQYQNQEKSRAIGVTAQQEWQFKPWKLALEGSWAKSRNQTQHLDYKAFPASMLGARIGYHAASIRSEFYAIERFMTGMDDVVGGGSGSAYVTTTTLPTYHRLDVTGTWHPDMQTEVQCVLRNVLNNDNYLPAIVTPGGMPDDKRSLSLGVRYNF